jgi:uncharacterized protein
MQGPERPDPKVLWVWRLSSAVTYFVLVVVVGGFVAALVLAGDASTWLLLLAAAPLLLWLVTLLTLAKQYAHWTFEVRPDALEMRHGWIWRNRRVVARDRIQHVDVNSGPFDRLFGLVQVIVYTAGATVGSIPGLTPERAEALRDELLAGRKAAPAPTFAEETSAEDA